MTPHCNTAKHFPHLFHPLVKWLLNSKSRYLPQTSTREWNMKSCLRTHFWRSSHKKTGKQSKFNARQVDSYQSVRRHVRGAGFKKKKSTEHKMCFFLIFFTALVETFLTLRRTECDMIRSLMCSTLHSYPILMSLEFSRQICWKKSSNIKFHKNPSSVSRVIPHGRTDGQTWQS